VCLLYLFICVGQHVFSLNARKIINAVRMLFTQQVCAVTTLHIWQRKGQKHKHSLLMCTCLVYDGKIVGICLQKETDGIKFIFLLKRKYEEIPSPKRLNQMKRHIVSTYSSLTYLQTICLYRWNKIVISNRLLNNKWPNILIPALA
jgi:hypothetical protein